ncbi:SGNH/GDSL hydrolase family protein [Candidatus Sumerlaeota bacterium]|nr:SGNH/GDSL hydrolase family protein [Candidatus Sumerlaeota bacterium]
MRFSKSILVILAFGFLAIYNFSFCVSPVISNIKALEKIDPAKGVKEPDSDLVWYEAKDLTIEGKGWNDTETFYNRLPARAKGKVTDSVWNLSKHTAGISVRFITDSKQIGAIWDGGKPMYHMANTANSGLDLYEKKDGKWEFCAVGRPKDSRTVHAMAKKQAGNATEYLLYLPLYNKVTELKIGIEQGAFLAPAPPRPKESKSILFYGTSITQGGCANRCGMCHAALLGRWLDREVINLGFSGAGKMEMEMAELLSELDPAVYVFECLPNMTIEMARERVAPFVKFVRKKRPDTPIILVENPLKGQEEENAELKKIYENLVGEGMKHLHYMPSGGLFDGEENGTVDGVHPTDLGFFRMAVYYKPFLEGILGIQIK